MKWGERGVVEINNWFEYVSVCLFVAGSLLAQGQLENSLQSSIYSAVCLGLEGQDEWMKMCKMQQMQQSNKIQNKATLFYEQCMYAPASQQKAQLQTSVSEAAIHLLVQLF